MNKQDSSYIVEFFKLESAGGIILFLAATLAIVCAIGGMLVPALIYAYFNYNDPLALKGWAIPAATDIAFALGALALLGSRVPTSLKIFLTSPAMFVPLKSKIG